MSRTLLGHEVDPDDCLTIGFGEDGVVWITACPEIPDAATAVASVRKQERSDGWEAVSEVHVAPQYDEKGRPVLVEYEEHEWAESRPVEPYSRKAWRIVDTAAPVIYLDGEEQANPWYKKPRADDR